MTKQAPRVESPLTRRPVQVTLATAITVVVLGTVLARSFGTSRGPERVKPTAVIEIELNHADARELALVPHIGPVLAKRIVANRQRHGDFASLEDLLRVPGIGPKTLQQIAKLCVIDPPPSSPATTSPVERRAVLGW